MNIKTIQIKHQKQFLVLSFLFIFLLSGLFLFPNTGSADGYPPYWNYSTSAVHFPPVPWPEQTDWIAYTYQGTGIKDQRTQDPSNGGTSPQNYVNVSSQCTDQSLPSIAWYFDTDKNVLFFRWRVEQIPNTYATDPSPGTYGNTDPWKSAQWTVMIDIDGDGYREFAFHLNGSSGSPSTAVDVLTSIYSNTPSQSLDYIGDPSIYELFHNPSAFVDETSGAILNFRNMFNPSISWPNGSSETVWDYGTTRSTDISTPSCTEYYIDYQIPLAMLDASAVGGPVVTADTPISLSFATANSLQNPLQKDAVFDGAFTATPDNCLPFGDTITLSGTTTILQPVVDWITAEGCDTTTLTAQVRDAIGTSCQDTITSVNFYYYYDKNANNIADDAGSSWTLAGSGTVDASDPSRWTYSGWDTTGLDRGQYLVGVQAKDNAVAGNSNLTFSYLATADLPASAPGETNYANPTPTPGIVNAIFNNTCGQYASAAKTVNPSITTVGVDVQFTITITNDSGSPFDVTQIDDLLPSGFSYQSAPVEGGTLAGSIVTRPLNGATGSVTWTFAGATIASGATGTLTFWADPSLEGTFTNNATVITSSASWPRLVTDPVEISVGAPRLSILKTASIYSVMADDTITYTISYSNDSPVNTTGVTITDALPVGMDFVAASYGGSYDSGTHTITWDIGNLPSMDGPYTVSYSVVVTQSAYTKSVNTATIDSNETAPSQASVTVFVLSPLKLEKTANMSIVDPAVPDQVTFTMTYTNRGTTALAGVTLTDPILDGFTFVSSALGTNCPVGTSDGTTVTWSIGAVAGSITGICNFTLQVSNPYSGTDNPAVNIATITATGVGPVTASAQVGITEGDCSGSPTIYYFKNLDASDYPDPVGLPALSPDSQFFANTTAPTNPTAKTVSAVAQVGVEDEFLHFYQDPPQAQTTGFSFVGTIDTTLYISKGPQKITVTAYLYDYDPETGDVTQIGTLASATGPGNRTNWPMIFNVAPTGVISQGNLILWRLTIEGAGSSSENITGLFDGTSSQSQAGVCFAPLSVVLTKQVDQITIIDGTTPQLSYTIVFSNTGAGTPFTGAQVVDTLPTGVTYASSTLNGVAASPVGGTCPANVCTFDVRSSDLPPMGEITGGQSGTLVITVNVSSPLLPAISTLPNTAELTTDDADPIYATAVTTVTPPTPLPDIIILKSADKTLLYPGDIVTYTLKVINAGEATSGVINVTDNIPADAFFTYVAGSITGGTSNSDAGNPTLTWSINSLAMGASTDLTFQMQVAGAGVPAGFYKKDNFASATEATPTTVPNSNTVSVTYTTNANIQVTKLVTIPAPYSQAVGTGANTLSNIPIHPGRLQVLEDGTLIGTDSGTGFVIGGNLKNSTIDYLTGDLYLEFITAPTGALTASYISPVSTGDTLEYTITVSSVGGSTATNVLVNDPIPTNMTYNSGTLDYQGSSQTDADDYPGTDNSHYDVLNDRTVFQVGDLAKGQTRTMKFRTTINSTLPYGTSSLTNTAYASSDNTATKEASTTLNITAAPELTLSKSAPSFLPYPLTTVTVGGVGVLTITVANIQYLSVSDVISINGVATTVTAINTTTRVLTLDTAVTAGAGTQVLPTMKFNLYYANIGNTEATTVTISDLLQSGLIFISADSGGTYDAPTTTVSWNIGTVAAGETGKVSVRVRPPGAGTYNNAGKVRSTELATVDSNTTITIVGAVELSKTTSTPAVVNGAGGTTASYTILLKNQLAITATGVYVTDPLPTGFTYTSTGGITGGLCQYTPRYKVNGTTAGTYYIAKLNHIAAADNRPTTGANWTTYWDPSVIGGTAAWINGFNYSPQNEPVWNNCTINVGATLTIPFTVAIASTVGTGTYQNPVTAISGNMSVLPFDELNTTAEDVTVSMPADLKVAKTVTLTPGCGVQVGCAVTYEVTITNVSTASATSFTVNDVLPASLTYTPGTATATEGAYDGAATAWNWTAVPAVPIPSTSSVVTSLVDGLDYTCIKNHASAAGNQPPNATYWVLGGSSSIPVPPLWAPATAYTSATAKLTIPTIINDDSSTITNTATITASAFTSGADTNSSNDSSTVDIVPTSITLSSFGAYEDNGNVVVEWETSSEVNTIGFFVSRLDKSSGSFIQLNSMLLPSVLTPPLGGSYSLIDKGAVPGKTYTYLLTEVEANGTINTYGPFIVTVNKSKEDKKSLSVTGSLFTASGITGNTGTDLFTSYTRKAQKMSDKKKVRLNSLKELRKALKKQKKKLSGLMIKIPVEKDGLYFFDASRISELMGISYDMVKYLISTNNLALSSQGNEVSLLSAEDSSGIFFYGLHTDSIYTKENIYWLYNGNGTTMQYIFDEGPAPVEQMTFLETVHAEEDKLIGTYPFIDPEADFWFWDQISSGYPAYDTKNFTIRTDGTAGTASNARLTVNLQGITDTTADPDHHVVVSVNGTEIGQYSWNGTLDPSPEFEFSQQLLNDGDNTVELRGLLDTGAPWSLFYIDSFDLTYQRLYEAKENSLVLKADNNPTITVYGFTVPDVFVFDITDPNNPSINTSPLIDDTGDGYSVSFVPSFTDSIYLATTADASMIVEDAWADSPSNLVSTKNKTKYIIIAPDELIESTQYLAEYRKKTGLKPMVVNVEDIMDEFNYGLSSPKAIQSFLTYAYYNWKKAPQYVLLVGDSSYDYRDNLNYGENLVPTMVVRTPMGLFTSDNILADVNSDHVPEIAIGRLPVLSSEELRDLTDKIIAFERNADNRIVMLADNSDSGGDFPTDSDTLALSFPSAYKIRKIYLSDYPTVADARNILFDKINIGTSIINYFGHAGTSNLAGEKLLDISDVPSLSNTNRPFIMNAMTCMVGQNAFPGVDSLSEALMLKKDGGAAAVWAPSGLAFHFDSKQLDEFFFTTAFMKNKARLGSSILESCRSFYNSGGPTYLLDIYNLQGDPALKLW